jgi:hypothetical protein
MNGREAQVRQGRIWEVVVTHSIGKLRHTQRTGRMLGDYVHLLHRGAVADVLALVAVDASGAELAQSFRHIHIHIVQRSHLAMVLTPSSI